MKIAPGRPPPRDTPDPSLLSADARPEVEWADAGPMWCGLRFYMASPHYVGPASAVVYNCHPQQEDRGAFVKPRAQHLPLEVRGWGWVGGELPIQVASTTAIRNKKMGAFANLGPGICR